MARRVAERADALPALAELFREHGYDGTSLALIGERTQLGKGSLYHFFPGGKEEMAAAVLVEIAHWFEAEVYAPLRSGEDAEAAIAAMLKSVETYFRSGRRVCLVGAFALGDARDRFADRVRGYFAAWIASLAHALCRRGLAPAEAVSLAEEAVGMIQGALVLARALDDPTAFERALTRLRARLMLV